MITIFYKFWKTAQFSYYTTYECDSMRKVLENRAITDEERMDALESQLKEARFMGEMPFI